MKLSVEMKKILDNVSYGTVTLMLREEVLQRHLF